MFRHKKLSGKEFIHTENTQRVQDYVDNHCIILLFFSNPIDGQKILERMQTQHLLEE